MIRERRQTTVPVAYQIPLICYPRKRKKAKKKILPQEGGYQSIPFPLKFAYTCGIYSFYGGITLKEHNGTLVTETPLLSQFLRCKEVQVRKEDNHKIISIAIQKNPAMQMPPWQHMVERLKESESHDLQSWGDLINEYCLKYEDKLRSLSNQELAKSPYPEDYLINMNKESEDKTNEIFRTYPTINFKATLEDNNMHLSEIVFNDKYLQGLGYSIDTFAVTTLRDGLPQLMPADNTYAVKMLLKNYYSLEKGGCQTPDLTSELILKKGYTRKVNYKVHYFATYKDAIFGVNCVLMITNREATAPPRTMFAPEFPLERDFIKEAVQKEQEAAIFLKKYYNTSPTLDYTNMDKICKVKYLGNPHNMPN